MKLAVILIYMLLWDVFAWTGTIWLIVEHGWSKWFIVLTILLTLSSQDFIISLSHPCYTLPIGDAGGGLGMGKRRGR